MSVGTERDARRQICPPGSARYRATVWMNQPLCMNMAYFESKLVGLLHPGYTCRLVRAHSPAYRLESGSVTGRKWRVSGGMAVGICRAWCFSCEISHLMRECRSYGFHIVTWDPCANNVTCAAIQREFTPKQCVAKTDSICLQVLTRVTLYTT